MATYYEGTEGLDILETHCKLFFLAKRHQARHTFVRANLS